MINLGVIQRNAGKKTLISMPYAKNVVGVYHMNQGWTMMLKPWSTLL